MRGCLAIAHGDLERAEKDLEEVLRIGRESGQPDAQAMYEEPLYVIRWHQGRLGEVVAGLRTVAALLPDVPTRWSGLACAETISGDAERARTMLRDAAQKDFAMLYGPPWLGCMCQWADVAAHLAEADAGAVLYERLLPWKHLFATGGPLPIHAVSLALGRLAALLGDVEAADGHFAEATLVHAAVRSPFGTALGAAASRPRARAGRRSAGHCDRSSRPPRLPRDRAPPRDALRTCCAGRRASRGYPSTTATATARPDLTPAQASSMVTPSAP